MRGIGLVKIKRGAKMTNIFWDEQETVWESNDIENLLDWIQPNEKYLTLQIIT